MSDEALQRPPRRGRPPRNPSALEDTREQLVRAGIELLTGQGFSSTGIDAILSHVGVPKGSFYHYFENKQAFGHAVLRAYDAYFTRKLDRHLGADDTPALERLRNFIHDGMDGMKRHDYTRGCLVGNLGQEVEALPKDYREQLNEILVGWQRRVADCLREAQAAGELQARIDADEAAEFFWIGWEGAILRARLTQNLKPLELFEDAFYRTLSRS